MGLLKGPPRLYGYGKIKNNRHWGTSSIKGAQQLEAEMQSLRTGKNKESFKALRNWTFSRVLDGNSGLSKNYT
jgi:hypothetical protein